jgi:hypothetical protein
VIHKGPFNDLTTFLNQDNLEKDFIDTFVIPYYMDIRKLGSQKNRLKNSIKAILPHINSKVVEKLLGDSNWRSRSVGSFLATLGNMMNYQEQIGRLLLKSEVTYAGTSYCLALAEFNNQESIDYLKQYLDYYLVQEDLWFDQGDAMGALAFLDKQNGTNNLEKYLKRWNDFVLNKPNWDLHKSIENFEKSLDELKEIKIYFSHKI